MTTTNGQEALKISRQEKPALILLDLNLPEIDGFTVLEELKGAKETKDIPVIVLTNFSNKEDINRCLNLGAKDYFVKSDTPISEVVKHVKKVL